MPLYNFGSQVRTYLCKNWEDKNLNQETLIANVSVTEELFVNIFTSFVCNKKIIYQNKNQPRMKSKFTY